MKPACLPAARVLNLALAAAVTGLLASGPAQAARGLDVRDLQQLERVSSPVLSPDGSRVVYTRREMSGASSDGSDPGKASTSLWVRGLGAGDTAPKRLTPVGWNVNSPEISADGKTLYFLSAQSGTQQVYAMPLAGGAPRQATHYPLDIGSFKASPDGRRLAVSMEVFPDCGADIDCTVKRLDQRKQARASGVLHDKLFVRHWDTWADGRINQLFVTSPSTGKIPPTTFLVDTVVPRSKLPAFRQSRKYRSPPTNPSGLYINLTSRYREASGAASSASCTRRAACSSCRASCSRRTRSVIS